MSHFITYSNLPVLLPGSIFLVNSTLPRCFLGLFCYISPCAELSLLTGLAFIFPAENPAGAQLAGQAGLLLLFNGHWLVYSWMNAQRGAFL